MVLRGGAGDPELSVPLRWWRRPDPLRERVFGSHPHPDPGTGRPGGVEGPGGVGVRHHPPSEDQEERAPRPSLSSWTAPRGASPTADPAFRAGLSWGLQSVRDAGCVCRSACGSGASEGPLRTGPGPSSPACPRRRHGRAPEGGRR